MLQKLTKNYPEEKFFIKRKAEYSFVLISIMISTILVILCTEYLLNENFTLSLIKGLVSIVLFIVVFILIYKGHHQLGINLMILLGFSRLVMVFNFTTPIQFYTMLSLILIAVNVIHTHKIQIILADLGGLTMALAQPFRIAKLTQSGHLDNRAFVESILSFFIIISIVVMLRFLSEIINREIHERQEISKLASLDPLTNIYNRRKITSIYEKLQADHSEIKVILFDIDDFKIINDTYGHDLGDTILKELSALIRDQYKDLYFARWGGEEFLILVSDQVDYGEAIRKVVMNHSFKDNISITISLGQAKASLSDKFSSVTKKADRAMYESKMQGKNKSTIYETMNEKKTTSMT